MVVRKSILASAALTGVLLFSESCNKTVQPNDDAITTDIKAKMFSEPTLKSALVNVVSKDGIVTITGQVPDDASRTAAERIASQTAGVKQVIDSTTTASATPPVTEAPAMSQAMTPAPKRLAPARKPKPIPQPAPSTSAPTTDSEQSSPVVSVDPGPMSAPAPATPVAAMTLPPAPVPQPPPPPPPPPPPQPITVTVPSSTILTIRT